MVNFTSRYVESLKPDPNRRLEYRDDDVRGLELRITPNGIKTWALRYRTPSGERRRLTLGTFPGLGLADARDDAKIALGAVAAKRDPAQEKLKEKREARRDRQTKPTTMAALWAVYDKHHVPKLSRHAQTNVRWLWGKHLEPRLGAIRLADVDRPTIRTELREVGETAPSTANKGVAIIRHMLNYAVEEDLLKANPIVAMGALFEEESRDRVADDAEIKQLWAALDEAPGRLDLPVSQSKCIAIKLVLATACRPNEAAGMHAREIDIAARTWIIPASRSKSGREQTVPLSGLAWTLLRLAFGKPPNQWSGYVFPNRNDKAKPMERASLTRAMSRIVKDREMKRLTVHDLRRTAATCLASERVGTLPHIVTAILGHQAEGPRVTGVYNRHKYDAEKRAALEKWAKVLAGIVAQKSGASTAPRVPDRSATK